MLILISMILCLVDISKNNINMPNCYFSGQAFISFASSVVILPMLHSMSPFFPPPHSATVLSAEPPLMEFSSSSKRLETGMISLKSSISYKFICYFYSSRFSNSAPLYSLVCMIIFDLNLSKCIFGEILPYMKSNTYNFICLFFQWQSNLHHRYK